MPYRDSPTSPGVPPIEARAPRSRNATIALALLVAAPALPLLLVCARGLLDGERQLPWSWVVIWAGLALSWVGYRRRRFQQGVRALLESQALLNAGSYLAGGECCEQILKKYRGMGAIEASALCNLSVTVYHRGNLSQALQLLESVERGGWCRPGSALRPILLQNRTLYHAILGNLPEAEKASREARSLMTAARASATMLAHDAVLAARAGRFSDVVAVTGTTEAMAKLQLKLLRVMRAWALKVTAPQASHDEVRMLVDGCKPVAAGELRYLTEHWPELRTFLVENGLAEAV